MRPAASDTALGQNHLLAPLGEGAASSVRNSRATVRGWRHILRPGLQRGVARGVGQRLRTTGAGACRGAGPRPASRRAAPDSSSHSRALRWRSRRSTWLMGGGPSSGVVGISRTTARSRSRHLQHPALAPRSLLCGGRSPAAGPQRPAAGESTACAFRRLPPWSRHAPPAVSQRARWRHDVGAVVPSAGSRRWWKCHLCPRVAVRHHPRVGPQAWRTLARTGRWAVGTNGVQGQ